MDVRSASWVVFAALAAGCSFPALGRASIPAAPSEVAPTASPAITLTTPEATISPTDTPTPTASPAAPCTDRASLIDDITIRDYTPLNPGEPFTKVWRLQNSGTCTWTPEYALVFFGGERMLAPASIPLAGIVPPGAMVDLAADMTAPTVPGTYEGFWRLRSPAGEYFGLGASGDQSFWVRIVVRPGLTPTVSPTPPPTASPTPAVLAGAALELGPGTALDLDSGRLDPNSGADLVFAAVEPFGAALLPQGTALISLYSPPPDPPRPIDCLAAPLQPEPVPAALLGPGTIACYLTGQSHPGYLVVVSIDNSVSLAFTTWVP